MSTWCNITVDDLGEVITGYTPPVTEAEYFGDEYPFITPTDITIDSRIVQTERFLSQKGYEYRKNRLLPRGAVCVTCIGATIGKLCMTTVPSATNQQINSVVVNQDRYDSHFVYYLLSTKTDVIQSVANGAATPIVKKSTFATINVCVPPLPTQRKIASFLDRKTRQIDELIRTKDRRIELLQEQRTALINQAVTKGLDPNAEMKPSGVEWIGEIPAHWTIRKNRHIFDEKNDRSVAGNEELLTVSHITGVSPRTQKSVNMFLAETLAGYKHCSVGNLVINTMWAWMGALGISEFEGIVSPAYNVYQLKNGEYLPKYYDYLYRTPNHVSEIIRWSKGIWHSRLRLYPDAFFSMSALAPPLKAQKQIANFLDHKTQQIDDLISTEGQKIELLKEYRQSLISEAVTGKIDVRNEV